MLRLRLGFLVAALVLSGCDHSKTNQAQADVDAGGAAVAQGDSAFTGQPAAPTYPRAIPVALPVDASAMAANPSPDNGDTTASASPDSETNAMAATEPAVDTTTPPPATPDLSSTAPPPSPSPADATASAAPAPVPDADAAPLALNSAPPAAAANPLPAPDNAPAQEQVVVLETSLGRIVIELNDAAAPRTCGNFRKLVSDGFYNHTAFHRVIPHFIIQGGDPNSKSDYRATYGQGGPGYTLPAEIKLHHAIGAVAMARLPDSVNPKRDSNGSQFYICVAACPSLDDQYTVFGQVIKGLDVAEKIAGQPRDARDNPLSKIEMEASLEPRDKAMTETASTP